MLMRYGIIIIQSNLVCILEQFEVKLHVCKIIHYLL